MSEYKRIEISLSSKKEVIAGLKAIGFEEFMISCPSQKVSLVDYHGRKMSKKVDIMVPQHYVNQVAGGRYANDLGFEKTKEGYITHISDMNQGWWEQKKNQFKQGAAEYKVEQKAKNVGYRVQKQRLDDGSIKLTCIKSF